MNSNLRTSVNGISLIKQFEGFRSEAYLCPANILTIGYGHTKGVKAGQKISAQEGEQLLIKDLETFENNVKALVKVPLNQNQFDALVCFTFNLGANNLSNSTLLKKLNQSDFASAALEFLKWNKAKGKVLAGLTKRREAESKLFKS